MNTVAAGVVSWAQFYDVGLYVVDDALYNAIGSTIGPSTIRDYLPHVNGMQSVQCPAVLKTGRNLLAGSPDSLHANAVLTAPYNLALTATALDSKSAFRVPAVPNQSYTFAGTAAGAAGGTFEGYWLDSAGAVIGSSFTFTSGNQTRVSPAGTVALDVRLTNRTNATGTFTFSEWMLILGTAADLTQSFEPRNDDYVIGVTDSNGKALELHGDPLTGVYDRLDFTTGEVYRNYRKFTLDGSLPWTYNGIKGTDTKYVIVSTTDMPITQTPFTLRATKHDGTALPQQISAFNVNLPDTCWSAGQTLIGIVMRNTDFGMGPDATPTGADIRAYFNGWKMNNGTFGTPFNGTGGTKTWTRWDATNNTGAVTSPPTTIASGYIPGSAILQLAKGYVESVTTEGSISMHTGGNYVEMLEGVVRREKVVPVLNGNVYEINSTGRPASALSKRTNRILAVYKGGDFNRRWSVQNSGSSYWYGGAGAQIPAAELASTNDVYVTYVAVDRQNLTAAATDGRIEYPGNPGSAIALMSQGLADAQTQIAVHKWLLTLDGAYLDNLRLDVDADKAALNTHRIAPDMDHPDKSVRQRHIGDGAVTDTAIGSRTANDTTAPTMTGPLGTLLSSLFSLIKRITGGATALEPPAANLNGLQANKFDKAGGPLGGLVQTAGSMGNISNPSSDGVTLEVKSAGGVGDAAFIAFHRPGYSAGLLGLDTDGKLKFGGWAYGAAQNIITNANFAGEMGIRNGATSLERWNSSTGQWEESGGVKRVLAGEAMMNNSDTYAVDITLPVAVNVSKSYVVNSIRTNAQADYSNGGFWVTGHLISPTVLRLQRMDALYSAAVIIRWQVIEG
ncbi:hypothetical protein WMW72_33965 [Paenibacillus filicis]|uniref:Tail fiber protein n=1 Tax=Paenibacillus filicis TaxID=669464 RepID=A0ABU9DXQ9_9BACL